ncbi:hypothetical protein ZIOFF_032587 [Zingiber officinale]|uniref:SAC domain-containing protein n=1 Tax=Zingiber officinale TaxID=94328 RepID=A0A8J5L6H8_ZINOF|nr:hypothetical protein ZIOFF_032587 [Zingiber officinale]
MLYERLALWQFPDKYVLEAIDVASNSCLSISRYDGSSSLIAKFPKCSTTCPPSVCTIFGVIGMLKLLVGGDALIKAILQANLRFVWNSYMLEALIDKENLDSYMLPIIQGSILIFLNWISGFQTFQATIGSQIINVTLIARRCMMRAGFCTRMWRRGADSQGNVANFVESEQILQTNGFIASFVCGSMPFLWEQIVDLTYKPKFEIVRPDDASMIGRKMLESQLRRIGLFGPDDTISVYPDLDANYKILWANHGDAISIQYSGTPALKGDFVR